MSREARANWWSMGVSLSFVIKSVGFSRLYVLGSGACCLIFWVNSLASLHAGTPRQLTTGRMGCSGLCSLISPWIVGAVGFMFTYCHLVSGGGNECFVAIYNLPDLGLEGICGVCCYGLELVS